MKVALKDFQEKAVRELLFDVRQARESALHGRNQAIVLSSPTGSGKTITLAALLESIVKGNEGHQPNPHATFLWVSDSPELNTQSFDKILLASDAFPMHKLVTVDASFDQERFHPGFIYFINTSKLGKDKLLTRLGDRRKHSFWQIVTNTVMESPADFFVIIDEAHRGMGMSQREREQAQSIVQKFILGSEEDRMPAVPIILGMSATPQRFTELIGKTNRVLHPQNINTEDVRDSGLLKELILVRVPSEDTPSDLTLLEESTRQWLRFCKDWESYCRSQGLKQSVNPVLVIQVEDGTESILTRTNLREAIGVIEGVAGPLSDDALAHCFQEDRVVEAGGRRIRKIDASRIQDERSVKIVFFKMSLTTGWDCPRAEVMMSFRKAKDHTLIAQLVGRMIRTPLARRIEGNEILNTVELYLPHYNRVAIQQIIDELKNPKAETGLGTQADLVDNYPRYQRTKGMEEAIKLVETLPSYSIGRVPELPPVKRLLRLASRLEQIDGIDQEAMQEAEEACLNVLLKARDRLLERDPKFAERVREKGELELVSVGIRVGDYTAKELKSKKVSLTEENIEDLFESCGHVLGVGEDLHHKFWQRLYDPSDPLRPKLELHEILKDSPTLQKLQRIASQKFSEMYQRNNSLIGDLPTSHQESYNRLAGAGKDPEIVTHKLPSEIVVRKGERAYQHHLYSDKNGEFWVELNTWERAVLDDETMREGFVGWLRNIDRKDWAIAVPYDDRGKKPFYPDFVIVRRERGKLVADLIDPHNSKMDDTWCKAKGLAEYAEDHGRQFGRLQIVIVEKGVLKRMDMNNPDTRKKAKKFQSNNDVDSLFV